MNEYIIRMTALCPNNQDRDEYTVSIKALRLIQCEEIIALVARFRDVAVYQEDLTYRLAFEFQAKVVVKGWHCNKQVFAISTVDLCGIPN